MPPRVQRTVAGLVGAVGLALLVMMVTTEGEPGALPLALVVIGIGAYAHGRVRERGLRR
jgi:hypothetical protein